ncbi:uncharacterized protein LOC107824088 [Nicotiana tabacum]|uniref:Uncharacterized protein LOC107824088 n=1 Tax=Nicotiana tabacum TaxID=4097 RepID=A0A1S4CYS5_TOBAC|nr:uncharacterized protein LOC104117995 [Nicotiana tomentosiformis]XP_016506298.1 PREDICTED: uncharacterized protein LOC107824088 [Nicotiana tabacum]
MSDGGLTVLDGSQLRAVSLSLPSSDGSSVTGAQLLDFAESKVSESLFGFSLPDTLKSAVLKRLSVADDLDFRREQLDRENASSILRNYVAAIVDELQDDPIVIAILDGKTLCMFLEDEDDFAMLAENLFTDLDTEDRGKIRRNQIRDALIHMGVEMGIPPLSEFPLLSDILKRHGAEGEDELGQAQFAHLLQPVLQELADALAKNPVVVVQKIKINNGSKLRKVLADEKQLSETVEKIMQEKQDEKDSLSNKDVIQRYLEKNGASLGLPPLKNDEVVILLYDIVLGDIENGQTDAASEKDEFMVFLKDILEKFAAQLEVNPTFHDLGN